MSGCERSGWGARGRHFGGPLLLLTLAGLPARAETPCVPAQTTQLLHPVPGEPPPAGPDYPGIAMPAGGYGPEIPAADAIDPPVPMVSVRVRVAPDAVRGRPLTYHLTVENRSRAAAHHVLLSNPLPAHVRFVSAKPEPTTREPLLRWNFGTLAAGAHKVVVLVVEPTGDGDIRNTARVQFEHGETVRTRIARPALQVRKFGPTQIYLFDQVTFRLEVTNTGRAEATGVVVKDVFPEDLEFVDNSKPSTTGTKPLTWKLGTLAPGEVRRIEFRVLARKVGKFTSRVEVEAAGGLRQEITHTAVVGEAKLTVVKSGPARRPVKRPTTYQITVANPGTLPATNVQVVDDLHYDEKLRNGIDFLGASDGGQLQGREVKWLLGTLRPGERRTIQVTVAARTPGTFINVVTVRADRDLSDKSQAPTRFEEPDGVTLEIDKAGDPLEVGRACTHTLRVLNLGKATAREIGLKVTQSEEMSITGARGATAPADQDGSQVRFASLPSLAAGAEAVYTITLKAQRPGKARMHVELTEGAASLGAPRPWEETTTILAPPSPPPPPDPAPEGDTRRKSH